jgi:hypothetical protein
VHFTAPDDGGSGIHYFAVTASPGGRRAFGERSPVFVQGLSNGWCLGSLALLSRI